MSVRFDRCGRCASSFCLAALTIAMRAGSLQAEPMYSITNLGTMPRQNSSVATAINNVGQVVGVSYTTPWGGGYSQNFAIDSGSRFQTGQPVLGVALPQSFLYSGGQMTEISPPGEYATAINNSGQVVGGSWGSINDSGQFIGDPTNHSLYIGGTSIGLANFAPYAINNNGQIAGVILITESQTTHAGIYQNGQVTDLITTTSLGQTLANQSFVSAAMAINQKGDAVIMAAPKMFLRRTFTRRARVRC